MTSNSDVENKHRARYNKRYWRKARTFTQQAFVIVFEKAGLH